MTAARDPRDLATVFGGVTLNEGQYPTVYLTKSEADLRRSLASVAHVYGWDVSEEVVIPGWGRIDLVLQDDWTHLVELKIELTKPAQVRRAFQQADGYGRWWTTNKSKAVDVHLVAVEIEWPLVNGVADAYYTVAPRSLAGLLGFLETGGTERGRAVRRRRAKIRTRQAGRIGGLYAAALARISPNNPAPETTDAPAETNTPAEEASA